MHKTGYLADQTPFIWRLVILIIEPPYFPSFPFYSMMNWMCEDPIGLSRNSVTFHTMMSLMKYNCTRTVIPFHNWTRRGSCKIVDINILGTLWFHIVWSIIYIIEMANVWNWFKLCLFNILQMLNKCHAQGWAHNSKVIIWIYILYQLVSGYASCIFRIRSDLYFV